MIIEVKPDWTGRVFKFKISDVDFGYNKPVYLWNEEKGEWKEVISTSLNHYHLLVSELGYDPKAKRCFHCRECEVTNYQDDVELLYEDIGNKLPVRRNACSDHADYYYMAETFEEAIKA